LLRELSNPVQRNKILTELNNSQAKLRDLIVTSTSGRLSVIGKTIASIAKDMEISSEAAVLKLIENGGSEVLVFDEALSQENVSEFLHHPLAMVASDGGGFDTKTNTRLVHPRCFGTAPRFLNQVITNKTMKFCWALSASCYAVSYCASVN
jgi:N-acyl-D-aspartate/D-glutamate deacylase